MAPIVTKEFVKTERKLFRAGERSALAKLNAIQVQAGRGEEITAAHLTRHGEDRMPGVEKFDLGDGFRLVTQLIDEGNTPVRVFLFAGTHDATESWLNARRGQRYVIDAESRRLELIPYEVSLDVARLSNPELAEDVAARPLLRHLTDADWELLNVGAKIRSELEQLTHDDFATTAIEDVLSRLPPVIGEALLGAMMAANDGSSEQVEACLGLLRGTLRLAASNEIAAAMRLPVNRDQFVTFADPEEINELLDREWEDWMLFLHAEQEQLARRIFQGPTRVRGVSGSGKTSILVHRARHLARRYRDRILIVTLTSSLTRLIEHLLGALCGVERSLIETTTASSFAHDVIRNLQPESVQRLRQTPPEQVFRELRERFLQEAGVLAAWNDCPLNQRDAIRYLQDDIAILRENYLPQERQIWLEAPRRGRGLPLRPAVRKRLLDAVVRYEEELDRRCICDAAGIASLALGALQRTRPQPLARCVLVDEGQDLSRNEMRILSLATDTESDDAFFLVADSAQRIIRPFMAVPDPQLDFRGRAFVIKKNYRNTVQVLRAARLLLETFDVAELEDDDGPSRIDVDYPRREGAVPRIIRFPDDEREATWIADEASRMRREEREVLGAGIAVLCAGSRLRELVEGKLRRNGVPVEQLRENVVASSDVVKVSTIESAKGHEFSAVFLAGLNEGVLPSTSADSEAIKRDASRTYVALTRARDQAFLTWSQGNNAKPSRFLTAMMGACVQARYDHRTGVVVED